MLNDTNANDARDRLTSVPFAEHELVTFDVIELDDEVPLRARKGPSRDRRRYRPAPGPGFPPLRPALGSADFSHGQDMVDVMVRVEPIRREWAEALAEGDTVFAQQFGIPVEAGWSGFPEALPILLQAATSGVPDEWAPQLFFDDDGALVGNGGWKGRPEHGAAELGYAVAPARQRRGIATAVVRELIERGRRAGLRVVVAHTLAEENASTKVLTRCGFTRTAELDDPDEGQVWRWELRLRP